MGRLRSARTSRPDDDSNDVSDWGTDDGAPTPVPPDGDSPLSIAQRRKMIAPTANTLLVDVSTFLRLTPDVVLLRWFNHHLSHARMHRERFVRRVYVTAPARVCNLLQGLCMTTPCASLTVWQRGRVRSDTTLEATCVTVCAWRRWWGRSVPTYC